LLKPSKCHLFQEEVEYVGHVVLPGQLPVNQKNIKSPAQVLLPRNQTELNSFLGMCNVYRRFIKYYAQISKPPTKLTSKKLPHVLPQLDAAHLAAFEYPTERLTSTPILALPRREGLFILDTNACAFQVGCTRSYNSRPHRKTGEPPMDLVTPRCLSKFSLEQMPDGMTPDAGQSVAEAKDPFLESLKAVLPQLRDSIAKTQAWYKGDYDKKVSPRRVSVTSCDWVYLRNHTRKYKLDPKVTGTYEVLETDGRTYLIDQDGLPYRVSGEHVVPAGLLDPANRPKQPQVAVPDARQPGGSKFVFEWFVDHTWDEEGVLWLLVRWFSYGPDDDTWKHSGRLPVSARGFSRRTQIRRRRVGTPRCVIGQSRGNKPSFIQERRLMVHPSLRGRALPRPTQSTLTPPKKTGTDLRHLASVQTTTGRRRALITGRSILAPISTSVSTRVLTRGARPRTRIVVATTPVLVTATAGATLGAPRRIPIPCLVGSRGILPTITGARPTDAPSTGLLHPPEVILLSLMVDVQETLELVVHA